MDIEVREVRDFLATHAPWDALPPTTLDALVGELSIRYYRRGTRIYGAGDPNNAVQVVRSGGVDLLDTTGQLVERLEPGGIFGATSVLAQAPSHLTCTAIEDTLSIVVPGGLFTRLAAEDPGFREFFDLTTQHRLRGAADGQRQSRTGQLALSRTVESFLGRSPVTAPSSITVQEAARIMRDERVSALLLVEEASLVGIMTDRDLRSKVIAEGLPHQTPVREVMTPDPITIGPDARAFEVLLEMSSRHIHHLPVVREGELLGLVSAGDVMRLDRAHPIYLAADIARQQDAAGVATVCRRIPQLVAEYVEADASASEISRLLSSINEAATRRLIALAERELGLAPAPWAWAVLGSQARHEAGLGSDQDHAIVLADAAADLDRSWWQQLAERVIDGLEQAGWPRCQGKVMADAWCHTSTEWLQHFSSWLNTPASQEVLHAQIFFDMRAVHGDASLVEDLLEAVTAITPQATRFLGHLATQAVNATPPLGFFKGFVLEQGGEHADTLNLKSSTHAIIQIARTHALAIGSPEPHTPERLRLAAAHQRMQPEQAESLLDAFEFINHLRLAHQAHEVRQGRRPDNHVDPRTLTALDRRTLKEAFEVIARAQKSLGYSHRTHLMS